MRPERMAATPHEEAKRELSEAAETSSRAAMDFTRRVDPAELPEWMDGPCSYEDFLACVRDIAATTRFTLAYGATQRFVAQICTSRAVKSPVHIVDVGCGGGDVLRRLMRLAQRRRWRVELTGIDLNPLGTRAAAELSAPDSCLRNIQWLTGDIFSEPGVQSPDVVLSSLVTHHMRDAEIVQFLRWMETHAHVGWMISDLVRSARSYHLFRLLSRIMRWHPFVRHDGPVSIRRAFREPDWHRLLASAEIPLEAVTLERRGLGRLCLSRLK